MHLGSSIGSTPTLTLNMRHWANFPFLLTAGAFFSRDQRPRQSPCGLTLPSRGRPTSGFAGCRPPLMSNVRPQGEPPMTLRSVLVSLTLLVLAGCVNTATQFKPAGFQSADEAKEYVPYYLYYAKKLTNEEWEAFYSRFPEYWKDIQTAKVLGG